MKKFMSILFLIGLMGVVYAGGDSPAQLKSILKNIPAIDGIAVGYDLPVADGVQVRGAFAGCDLNQNGYPEVVLTDYADGGKFHVYEIDGDNNATEIFVSEGLGSSSGSSVRCVQVADLNGNGDYEVIISVNGQGGTDDDIMGLMIYEYSTTAGSFVAPYHTVIDDGALINRINIENFYVGDVDLDGTTEALISNNGSGDFDSSYVISFSGDWAGTVNETLEFGWGKNGNPGFGGSAYNAIIGDTDGDGYLEAIFGIWDNASILIAEAVAPDTYEFRTLLQTDLYGGDAVSLDNLVIADLDEDGKDEVYQTLYSGAAAGSMVGLKYDDADDYSVYEIVVPGESGGYGIGCGDLDGNGLINFYTAGYGGGIVLSHEFQGGDITDTSNYVTTTFATHTTASGSYGIEMPAVDMDDDGKAELVVTYLEGGTIGATVYEFQETTTEIGWCNLQWPDAATITQGESVTAYAQVWAEGATDTSDGAAEGMGAWFGLSAVDTDPASWEDWMEASFNVQVGNNDEFMMDFVGNLPPGTYYYASRFKLNDGDYFYGGYNSGGGGYWDGVNNVSGVLTIEPLIITDYPYTIDFEDGLVLPSGWLNLDEPWSLGSEANSGSYCAQAEYNHSADIPATLSTPGFTLPENYGITFFWKDDDINNADNPAKQKWLETMNDRGIEIIGHDTTFFEISVDGTDWETLVFLSDPSHATEYSEQYLDLSAYSNQTVWFRWRDVTDATYNAYGIGLDDIVIEENSTLPPNCATDPDPADSTADIAIMTTLSWVSGGGAPTGFKVYLGTDNPPVTEVYDGAGTTFDITTPLNYSTEYFWQVVPYNANGNAVDCPVWMFSTLADPTLQPGFVEEFEDATYPPTNWTRYSGYLEETSVLTTTTSGWIKDDFANITDPVNKAARNNIYGTSRNHWLMTPPIALPDVETDYQLEFDLALTEYGNQNPATLGVDDIFAVVISTDMGVTWSSNNVLRQWDSTTPIPNGAGEHITIDLSAYTGTIMIGFYGESATTNEDNDLFVDNVTVDEAGSGQITVGFNVMESWNIVAVPVLADDMAATALFQNATSPAYMFADGYVTADVLVNGLGYWLKFDAAESISISGTQVTDNIPLVEGWNLLGGYNAELTVANIVTNPAGIIESMFFGFNGAYFNPDVLTPGYGYWVKTNAAGSILTVPVKRGKSVDNITISQDWGSILIQDAAGRSTKLYVADESVSGYQLPPVPPEGAFDARFSTGSFVEVLSTIQDVVMSSAQYPVKVTVNGTSLKLRDKLNGEYLNASLTDGQSVVINNPAVQVIEVSGNEVPVAYELGQNYPNPFNPATTIRFSMPYSGNVKLSVFNVLGEEVASLVNSEMDAGYHVVNFNASELSSGVYFYTIEVTATEEGAEGFVNVKKMMLLK